MKRQLLDALILLTAGAILAPSVQAVQCNCSDSCGRNAYCNHSISCEPTGYYTGVCTRVGSGSGGDPKLDDLPFAAPKDVPRLKQGKEKLDMRSDDKRRQQQK